MKRLYAIDLDGTLLYPKHPKVILGKKTKNIIRSIIDKGDVFSVVSGRNIVSCKNIFSLVNRDPYIIGCNGAYIFVKDKFIKNETLEKDVVNEICDYVKNKKHHVIANYVMTSDGKFILREKMPTFLYRLGQRIYDFFQGNLLEDYLIDAKLFKDCVENNTTRKLMIMYGITNKAKELARIATEEIKKKFGKRVEVCWSNQAVEISPKGCTKSNGILELADTLGIKKENIYVMGDSGNDISMFKEFYEHSYCISKAHEDVAKHAKHTIKCFDRIEEVI